METQTFKKLTLVAQYDDLCRVLNKLMKESTDEENACIAMLESLQKRWENRQRDHEREKEVLRGQIGSLEKEIKKLNRQLAESRSALMRETNEKKAVAQERINLMNQINQVRQLVEKEDYRDTDAHRRRVIKCLDIERLSPIASDDSDDCASGLEYDRTEEDILDTNRSPHHSRRSAAFENILETLQPNEQPTLLYRFLDKEKSSDEDLNTHNKRDEPRRSSRHTTRRSQEPLSDPTSATSSNHTDIKTHVNLDTDSSQTDYNDIECVRQQIQKYEAEKREKLAATNSTPNIKDQKRGATLSAKSTANMLKSLSTVNTPVPNAIKPHTFTSKKCFKPEYCVPCGGRVGFYGDCSKCEVCGVISHPDCRDKCPLPCVKITAPNTRSRQKKVLISDYVNSDSVPKVPALIVHCCNEIERGDNIKKPGLYRASAHHKDVEELLSKILKSKSGMPNLSNVEVDILTGVVRTFLQQLDESLITTTLWNSFAAAARVDKPTDAEIYVKYHISSDLPPANRDTIAFLMQHLHAIARHSSDNMMTLKNLAKALAPTIVGNSSRATQSSQLQNETKTQVKIMEILLDIEESFWSQMVPRASPQQTEQGPGSLGSRLLAAESPAQRRQTRSRTSRLGGSTLPTPKLKPLFS